MVKNVALQKSVGLIYQINF